MNVIINKSTLRAVDTNRLPRTNEFEILNVQDIQKEIQVPVKIPKVNKDSEILYLLPRPDKEIVTPTPRLVETTESKKEDGTPNTPVMERKSRQISLLDENGKQVQYYPTTIRYEQQEVGKDEDDNPIFEEVEIIEVSETPILCFTSEEYDEQKVDIEGNKIYLTEIMEDVISYEPQKDWEITEDHNSWTEDLEVILIDAHETKTISLFQEPEHFHYIEIEPTLDTYKQLKIKELDSTCNLTILNPFTSNATGEEHVYGCDYEDQQNLTATLSMFNTIPELNEITWTTKDAGRVVLTKEQFIQLCQDAFMHKESNIVKFHELKELAELADSIDGINSVVW